MKNKSVFKRRKVKVGHLVVACKNINDPLCVGGNRKYKVRECSKLLWYELQVSKSACLGVKILIAKIEPLHLSLYLYCQTALRGRVDQLWALGLVYWITRHCTKSDNRFYIILQAYLQIFINISGQLFNLFLNRYWI